MDAGACQLNVICVFPLTPLKFNGAVGKPRVIEPNDTADDNPARFTAFTLNV